MDIFVGYEFNLHAGIPFTAYIFLVFEEML